MLIISRIIKELSEQLPLRFPTMWSGSNQLPTNQNQLFNPRDKPRKMKSNLKT